MADDKPTAMWKKPDEVNRLHKLKLKKKALQARMEKSLSGNNAEEKKISLGDSNTGREKRKNPFKLENSKKMKLSSQDDLDISNDNTLFQLLNINKNKEDTEKKTKPEPRRLDFSNILSSQSQNSSSSSQTKIIKPDDEIVVMKAINEKYIPIDWTLKSKLRFLSTRPFAWNQKLKTSEESSGITAFVRCLDPLNPNRTVDISTNALFHQFCLVWQHPSLPWLETFPRTSLSSSDKAHLTPSFIKEGSIKESLYQDWVESFSSLFQLLRAKQCPYFYVMANQFTCLFRAAGICGIPEMHALLTPTTRGFRKLLKDDDVVFSMPLDKTSNKNNLEKRLSPDTGYATGEQDENESKRAGSSDPIESDYDDEDDNEAWLEECGLAPQQIQQFNTKQKKIDNNREKTIDKTPESLIYVEGVEVQALFNFLVNCKSATSLTGPLAGIPPTLLSSVAFHGATLKTLKVKQGMVKIENKTYHSMELRGPILPNTIHNLCELLEGSLEEFSVTFANIEPTKSFSFVKEISDSCETRSEDSESTSVPTTPSTKPVPSIFGRENLSDCGLSKKILDLFTGNEAFKKICSIESLKHNANRTYSWL